MAEWRIKLACGHSYLLEKPPKLTGPYLCGEHDGSKLASIISAERLTDPPVDREVTPHA